MGHDVYFMLVCSYAIGKEWKKKQEEGIHGCQEQWGNHFFCYRTGLYRRMSVKILEIYRKWINGYYSHCDDKYPQGIQHYVNNLNLKYSFDACIINYFWLSKVFDSIKIPRKAIITHDSFTYNNLRNNVRAILNLTPNEEAKALQRCPYIYTMQDDEAIFFRRIAPRSNVLISFCPYKYETQPIMLNHTIVFLSSGFYLNVNGLTWFLEEVYPLLLKEFPDFKLIVGGSICNEIKDHRKYKNLVLQGYIDNPATFYAQGDVAINPTYQGTGLKIKTFEAISYGKATIVHPHSIGGIYKKEEAPLFVSDNPKAWVGFFHSIWDDKAILPAIKEKCCGYIEEMNRYIEQQFSVFLNEKE